MNFVGLRILAMFQFAFLTGGLQRFSNVSCFITKPRRPRRCSSTSVQKPSRCMSTVLVSCSLGHSNYTMLNVLTWQLTLLKELPASSREQRRFALQQLVK